MMAKCEHKAFGTHLSAGKYARSLDLVPRKVVRKCETCGKWRVVV